MNAALVSSRRLILQFLLIAGIVLFPPYAADASDAPPPSSTGSTVEGLTLPPDMTVSPDEGFVLIAADSKGTVKFLVIVSSAAVRVKYSFVGNSAYVAVPPVPGTLITVFAVADIGGKLTDFAHTAILVQGKLPPVDPPPPPPPSPPLKPLVTGRLHVTIVEDPVARTPAQAAVITSETIKKYLGDNGYVLRVLDIKDPIIAARQLTQAVTAGGPLPVLLLQDDAGNFYPTKGKSQPLPATEADLLSLLKQLTGK